MTTSLHGTKQDFKEGRIGKPEYIERMHELHRRLFEYAEFIKDTDIAGISVTDGAITMTTRAGGIKLACDFEDKRFIPVEILNFGSYESEETGIILSLVDDGATVLDIGCNIGWYSMNIALSKKDVNILSFEPIPRTFEYLKKNLAMNGITCVRPFNNGFSDREQELTFYYYRGGSGNASMADLSGDPGVEKITCPVTTLDSFAHAHEVSPRFIKCDVEGAELMVFKGGLKTIEKSKPVIFAELLRKWSAKFDYHPNEVITLLCGLGYRCFTVKDGGLAAFDKMDEDTSDTNFFFLHPDVHAEKIARLERH